MMIEPGELRFLHTLLSAPSLSAAARTLHVTQSAVSQRIAHIEHRIGVRLLDRTGRVPTLTGEGQLVVKGCENVMFRLAELNEQLTSRRETVRGELSVVAPFGFGRIHVAPIVSEFRKIHREVQINLTLSDRLGRYPEDGFDIMIFVGELPQTNLVRRRLARNRRMVCASPAFLEKSKWPSTPDELHRLNFIALCEDDSDGCHWRFEKDGRAESVTLTPGFTSNDGEVTMGWALDGAGFIIRSEWILNKHLREGRLVQLIPSYELPEAAIVALYPNRNLRAQRVVAFSEFIATKLSQAPWL